MAVLVIADHDGSAVRDTTHKTVTAAKAISGDVDVLVLGKGAQAVADAAAKIDGVRKVLLAEGEGVSHGLAEAVEATVVPLAANYDAILVPANTDGKNYAPRIAAKLAIGYTLDELQNEITGGATPASFASVTTRLAVPSTTSRLTK